MRIESIQKAIDAALLTESRIAASIFTDPVNARGYSCSVDGCGRQAYAARLCNAHYLRKRKGLPLDVPVRARKRDDKCAVCGKKCGAKGGWGLCPKHYRSRRYKAIKSALVEWFGGKCAKCGGVFPLSVYDFHHLSSKEDSPGSMLLNASTRDIARELSKCVLLCANCHRIEHDDIRQGVSIHSP